MCNKADNSCRQEKRGCQGCYYNRGFNHKYIMLCEMIENAIKTNRTSLLISKNKYQFILDLKGICMSSLGMLTYKVEDDRIIVIGNNKKLLIIQDL